MKSIAEIKQILSGNSQELTRQMMEEMQRLASEMRFEEAQIVKEKYQLLENYRAKSTYCQCFVYGMLLFKLVEHCTHIDIN